MDGLQEDVRDNSQVKLGTTKKGIGPTYASKANRSGIRMADLVAKDFEKHFVPKFKRLAREHENQFSSVGFTEEELQVDFKGRVIQRMAQDFCAPNFTLGM